MNKLDRRSFLAATLAAPLATMLPETPEQPEMTTDRLDLTDWARVGYADGQWYFTHIEC